MKKTIFIDEKKIINDWDLVCVYYFNEVIDSAMDFALDNIIDIINF